MWLTGQKVGQPDVSLAVQPNSSKAVQKTEAQSLPAVLSSMSMWPGTAHRTVNVPVDDLPQQPASAA
jgi:hypothetical protein